MAFGLPTDPGPLPLELVGLALPRETFLRVGSGCGAGIVCILVILGLTGLGGLLILALLFTFFFGSVCLSTVAAFCRS